MFSVLGVEGGDVAAFLFFEDLVDGEEYAAFFDIAKFVVDCRSKHSHGGRQAHVGVDERRDVEAVGADFAVENLVVVFECVAGEELLHFRGVKLDGEGIPGGDEVVVVGEVFVEEVENEVATFAVVAGVHGHFAEQMFDFGMENGQRPEAVPEVVECVEGF